MKNLYYFCPVCNDAFIEAYESEYGECDSECKCGKTYSPFLNKKEWLLAQKENILLTKTLTDLVIPYLNHKYATSKIVANEKFDLKDQSKSIIQIDGYFNNKYKVFTFSKTKKSITYNGKDITQKILKHYMNFIIT